MARPTVAGTHTTFPETGTGGGGREVAVTIYVGIYGLAALRRRLGAGRAKAVQARRPLVPGRPAHSAEAFAPPLLGTAGRLPAELLEVRPLRQLPPTALALEAQPDRAAARPVTAGRLAHSEAEHRVLGARREDLVDGVPAQPPHHRPVDQPREQRFVAIARLHARLEGRQGFVGHCPSFRCSRRRCRLTDSTAATASRMRRWLAGA